MEGPRQTLGEFRVRPYGPQAPRSDPQDARRAGRRVDLVGPALRNIFRPGRHAAPYRQALAKDPNSVIALNNLAYVLAKSGGSLTEAQQLVAKAIQLRPNTPAFLDTKATIQAALKDYAGAIASLKEARRLDPNNFTWRINMLAVLIDAGQTPAARTEMQQIGTALSAAPDLSPELRQRYEALRAKLE